MFFFSVYSFHPFSRTTHDDDDKKERKKERKEKPKKQKRDEDGDSEGEWETVKGGATIPSVSD